MNFTRPHIAIVFRPFLIYLSRSQSRVSGYEGRYLDQTPWFLGIYVLSCEGTIVANRAGANRVVGRELKFDFTATRRSPAPLP